MLLVQCCPTESADVVREDGNAVGSETWVDVFIARDVVPEAVNEDEDRFLR